MFSLRHIAYVFCAFAVLNVAAHAQTPKPKLVLQITVDQLRGDLVPRYIERMGEGGFKYLFSQGIVFGDAHHLHANTETIVGHTTLATGANPSSHGMVGNVWFNYKDGRLQYNVEDADYPILTEGAGVNKETEIDPTQRAAKTDGRSPRAIMVSTFSDELAIATTGKAKVFGVSVKDRGAIAMAGHAGKAFWFSKQSGTFITSSFYYDKVPDWVAKWNAKGAPFEYAGKSWELLNDKATYQNGNRDDLPYETELPGFGRTFPHPFGQADDQLFTTLLTVSPAGDQLTVDFAKTLFDAEKLGDDDITDYLSVSLSSTDYVGHVFGPSSLEAEDNLLRLDQRIAELLKFVDERIGLDNTLIVLSADHGGAEPPGYLQELGIPAMYIDPESWEKQPSFDRLKERFGIGEKLVQTYFHPYLYLDREAIAAQNLDFDAVSEAVAVELSNMPGVFAAYSSVALAKGQYPKSRIIDAVMANYNAQRSGDVFVVFQPHSFINDFDGLTVASHHSSPWQYDSFVPMIFAGFGLKPTKVARRVHTIDLAPTLSSFMQIKPPSGADGVPLPEVINGR